LEGQHNKQAPVPRRRAALKKWLSRKKFLFREKYGRGGGDCGWSRRQFKSWENSIRIGNYRPERPQRDATPSVLSAP